MFVKRKEKVAEINNKHHKPCQPLVTLGEIKYYGGSLHAELGGQPCMSKNFGESLLTLVALGCQNYVKPWGGGRSALPLKNSKIGLKTVFFSSLPLFASHQNNNGQG